MHEQLKKALQELSHALQDLHKDLLMLEAKSLETEAGLPVNPYDLLQASLHDPNFAWLRKISTLIVHIDIVVEEATNLSGIEANQINDQVLRLIEKPEPKLDLEFWTKYSAHLSVNPDIIMKHSRVKTILNQLRPNI